MLNIGLSNLWLGTQDSYNVVSRANELVASGKLFEMIAKDPKIETFGRTGNYTAYYDDNDEERIGSMLMQVTGNVAVITASGSLVARYAWYNAWLGLVSYEEIRDALDLAANDENVKKIILRVESGGGDVNDLDETSQMIKRIDKEVKPVEAYTSSGAMSAGYWLVSSCRKITAARMASTGSIGVIMTLTNLVERFKSMGVQFHIFRSGKLKALGQPSEEVTDEVKDYFQAKVMEIFTFFRDHVYASRPALAAINKESWLTGETFLSKKSLDIGLIDSIGTFDNLIAKLLQPSNNGAIAQSKPVIYSEEVIMKLKLTNEQKDKLRAGVPITAIGLSEEDLSKAQAILAEGGELDTEESEESSEETEANGETETESEEGTEASSEETEEEAEEESSTEANSEVFKTLMATNADLVKQVARLEVSLEAKDKEISDKDESLEAMSALQKDLVVIGANAVNKMQVAMNMASSLETLKGMSASDLVKAHGETEEKFNKTFSVGRASAEQQETREEQTSLSIRKLDKK